MTHYYFLTFKNYIYFSSKSINFVQQLEPKRKAYGNYFNVLRNNHFHVLLG